MTATLASRILNNAADLIEPEGRWTQGAEARNAYGRMVLPNSANACCWCMRAALIINAPNIYDYIRAKEIALKCTGAQSLIVFNDSPGRTQAEVVAALRAAAKMAEADEQSGVKPPT